MEFIPSKCFNEIFGLVASRWFGKKVGVRKFSHSLYPLHHWQIMGNIFVNTDQLCNLLLKENFSPSENASKSFTFFIWTYFLMSISSPSFLTSGLTSFVIMFVVCIIVFSQDNESPSWVKSWHTKVDRCSLWTLLQKKIYKGMLSKHTCSLIIFVGIKSIILIQNIFYQVTEVQLIRFYNSKISLINFNKILN